MGVERENLLRRHHAVVGSPGRCLVICNEPREIFGDDMQRWLEEANWLFDDETKEKRPATGRYATEN